MKVGDTLPPARVHRRPCPSCKDAVFQSFATGYVAEFYRVATKSPNGFNIAEHWSCPACGYKELKFHEVDTNGLRIQRKPNSSYKPKKKKSKQK